MRILQFSSCSICQKADSLKNLKAPSGAAPGLLSSPGTERSMTRLNSRYFSNSKNVFFQGQLGHFCVFLNCEFTFMLCSRAILGEILVADSKDPAI